jgi:uncharacterized protein YjbI with pentapeptide repeats
MMTSRFRVRTIAALCAALALTGLQFAAAANPDQVAKFRNTRECPGCDLSNAALGGIQAPNANLTNANLRQANLYGAKLRGADLTGAILDGANLQMADLSEALGAVLSAAKTDERTTCPNGSAGPCQ